MGQGCTVHLHLQDKRHSLVESKVDILGGEDRGFERGTKEAACVKLVGTEEVFSDERGNVLRSHQQARLPLCGTLKYHDLLD